MPYVKAAKSDSVRDAAIQALAALDSQSWHTLESLARSCTSGRLSFDAWQTATGAIVTDALRRAESEGFCSFQDA